MHSLLYDPHQNFPPIFLYVSEQCPIILCIVFQTIFQDYMIVIYHSKCEIFQYPLAICLLELFYFQKITLKKKSPWIFNVHYTNWKKMRKLFFKLIKNKRNILIFEICWKSETAICFNFSYKSWTYPISKHATLYIIIAFLSHCSIYFIH